MVKNEHKHAVLGAITIIFGLNCTIKLLVADLTWIIKVCLAERQNVFRVYNET